MNNYKTPKYIKSIFTDNTDIIRYREDNYINIPMIIMNYLSNININNEIMYHVVMKYESIKNKNNNNNDLYNHDKITFFNY